MRPRTLVALSLSIVSLSLLSSCDALFTTNLFKEAGLGQVSASALAEKDSSGLYEEAYTSDGSPSDTFFEALSGDATAKSQVLSTLQTDYSNTSSPTAQQSAILYADIELRTTGGSEVVSNIVGYLAGGGAIPSDSTGVKSFIESVVPASVLSDRAAFDATIAAFLDANTAYIALGASVGAGGADAVLPQSVYANAVQAAVLSAAIASVEPTSGNSVADALWAALQGDNSKINTVASPTVTNTGLADILSAGGYSPADFGL